MDIPSSSDSRWGLATGVCTSLESSDSCTVLRGRPRGQEGPASALAGAAGAFLPPAFLALVTGPFVALARAALLFSRLAAGAGEVRTSRERKERV